MDSYYWSFDFYFFLLVCTEFYSDTGLCFLVDFDKKDFQSRICRKIYRQDLQDTKELRPYFIGIGSPDNYVNYSEFCTGIISLAIWFFAVIEWVNYFKMQLSYSLNPAVLLKYIFQRKLRKSKIAKEIEKAV